MNANTYNRAAISPLKRSVRKWRRVAKEPKRDVGKGEQFSQRTSLREGSCRLRGKEK